jgi:hypothetical protein
LHPPTLSQWGCEHRWKTTTSRPGEDGILRLRYLTCKTCGLKVKSEEQLAVPWNERDFMSLVAQIFPEGAVVDVETLKAHGWLGGGVSQLNAHLVPHGWQLDLVRDRGRVAGIVRRRMSPDASGGAKGALDSGRTRHYSKRGL